MLDGAGVPIVAADSGAAGSGAAASAASPVGAAASQGGDEFVLAMSSHAGSGTSDARFEGGEIGGDSSQGSGGKSCSEELRFRVDGGSLEFAQ